MRCPLRLHQATPLTFIRQVLASHHKIAHLLRYVSLPRPDHFYPSSPPDIDRLLTLYRFDNIWAVLQSLQQLRPRELFRALTKQQRLRRDGSFSKATLAAAAKEYRFSWHYVARIELCKTPTDCLSKWLDAFAGCCCDYGPGRASGLQYSISNDITLHWFFVEWHSVAYLFGFARSRVMQRYIVTPLLFQRRKFDLRVFVHEMFFW